MVTKYTKIFHCKTLQNLPEIGIFGLKTNHLATLHVGMLQKFCFAIFKKVFFLIALAMWSSGIVSA
jgi:hypothetical protein